MKPATCAACPHCIVTHRMRGGDFVLHGGRPIENKTRACDLSDGGQTVTGVDLYRSVHDPRKAPPRWCPLNP